MRRRDEEITKKLESLAATLYKKMNYYPIAVEDRTAQLHGVDWIDARTGIRVDDKAAISAWNRPLESFGFEIECGANVKNEGWFSQKNSWTTHYGLIFPRGEDPEFSKVTRMEIILVSKKNIWKFLQLHGVLDAADAMNMMDWYALLKGDRYILDIPGCGFIMKNWRLRETPVNIHIKTKYLRTIADKVYVWNNTENVAPAEANVFDADTIRLHPFVI